MLCSILIIILLKMEAVSSVEIIGIFRQYGDIQKGRDIRGIDIDGLFNRYNQLYYAIKSYLSTSREHNGHTVESFVDSLTRRLHCNIILDTGIGSESIAAPSYNPKLDYYDSYYLGTGGSDGDIDIIKRHTFIDKAMGWYTNSLEETENKLLLLL
jgi:hypothetical protein